MRPRRILFKPHVPVWSVRWSYREIDAKARAVWCARDNWIWVAW